jgi:hypothetical protein
MSGTFFSVYNIYNNYPCLMEPLFEAKALYVNEYALYNIYRIAPEKYKAQLITDENDSAAPMELLIIKSNGQWQTEDPAFNELGTTLGVEIDVFNHGYGDILGRIGID